MKRIKTWWILLAIVGFVLLAFCINMFILKVIVSEPKNAFKDCFGFHLPNDAEIVNCNVKRSIVQGRPNYAFEIILFEEQYQEMKVGLEQYEKNVDKTRVQEEKDLFLRRAKVNWPEKEEWRELDPDNIVSCVSFYYDMGYDLGKGDYSLYLMFSVETNDTYRMYAFTGI